MANAYDAENDLFWASIETWVCAQINHIDEEVERLYTERDRLQFFLNDHGRRCNKEGRGEGVENNPPDAA